MTLFSENKYDAGVNKSLGKMLIPGRQRYAEPGYALPLQTV